MAQGDAQRIWYPEMVEALRAAWHPEMDFDALVALRDRLDDTLQRLRDEARIRCPIIRCKCGFVGRAEPPHLGVRAMILSLNRFGIAAPEPTFALEKSWAAHRREHGLDSYGKPSVAQPVPLASCGHPAAGVYVNPA